MYESELECSVCKETVERDNTLLRKGGGSKGKSVRQTLKEPGRCSTENWVFRIGNYVVTDNIID